jgi:hypothetical protein
VTPERPFRWFLGVLFAGTLAVSLVSEVQEAKGRAATPVETRTAIDNGLQNGGTYTLPAGVVEVDRWPTLTSGCTLKGDPRGTTVMRAAQTPTMNSSAPGLGYTNVSDVSGPLRVGEWVYRFQYAWWWQPDAAKALLCKVSKVTADSYATEPAPDPRHNVILRFRQAWPCGSPQENADKVTLTVAPAGLSVGQWVYVTDGPSVADAARGEYRQIKAINGQVVSLHGRLRQSYGPAVLAWTEPLVGATVTDLRIESPSHGDHVPWSGMVKGCVNFRMERCSFNGMADLICCTDATVVDCSGPAFQLNTTSGCRMDRCRFGALYMEESASDIDVTNSEFGRGRVDIQNCVTGWFGCDRLRFRNCRIIGAGSEVWPPPSPFNLGGKDCSLIDIEVAASRGGAATYLSGAGIIVRGWRGDGPVYVLGSKGASVSQVRVPYLELTPADPAIQNVAVDCSYVNAGTGWQTLACQPWKASATSPQPKQVPQKSVQAKPKSALHERLRSLNQNAQPGNSP